jgi:hypothetical protein
MGVDFWICHFCKDTFPDCGDYTRCNTCEIHWCSDDCAIEEGWIDSEEEDDYGNSSSTCSFCRNESAEDSDLLDFALEKLGISREDLEEEYLTQD